MTPDNLTALIAECDASPPDTEGSDTRMLIDPRVLAEIARDARRFRWLAKSAECYPDPDRPARYARSVQWGMWCDKGTTLRAAIDADMGEAP